MDILIIRHGIADEPSPGTPDHERRITREGRERLVEIARGLGALDLRPSLWLHSPWRRAKETAAQLASALGGRLESTDELARAPRHELLAPLADLAQDSLVACVGHEPWMGELVALLLSGDTGLGSQLPMKKAGVAHLRGTPRPGAMELVALLPPRVLRRVGPLAE